MFELRNFLTLAEGVGEEVDKISKKINANKDRG